jgi:hypothetical protein
MAISTATKRWLDEAGFKHFCFISYPHGGGPLTDFARRISVDIEAELRTRVTGAKVFFDSDDIPPGATWPESLRKGLCTSVAMVAVLAPIYLEEVHEWCGREWAAMASLGQRRLPDDEIQPIIPVFFRQTELPRSAGARQPIDLSRVSLKGRRYYSTEEFRGAVLRIVDQIIEIACRIHEKQILAEVEAFEMPVYSAFVQAPPPNPPLRIAV